MMIKNFRKDFIPEKIDDILELEFLACYTEAQVSEFGRENLMNFQKKNYPRE